MSRPRDDERWLAQMRRGSLELCVLAILSRGRRYGYDIVQALATGGPLSIKEGTIYPLLNRLKGEGLVHAEWQPSPEGPARKYYTLTDAGKRRLAEMRDQWSDFRHGVESLLDAESDEAGSADAERDGGEPTDAESDEAEGDGVERDGVEPDGGESDGAQAAEHEEER